jgi:hypothetical protein
MKSSWLEGWALPPFFVSVASKGFRFPVNSLESTLMGILAGVASKGLGVNTKPGEKQDGAVEEPFDSPATRGLRMCILRGMRKRLSGTSEWRHVETCEPWDEGDAPLPLQFL